MRALYSFLLVFVLAACSGGEGSDVPVPRREAYHRIAQYPARYLRVDSVPLRLVANEEAVCDVDNKDDGTCWATIEYPRYKAKIYCTLTPVDESNVQRVIANRMQRISLNAGDRTPDTEEITNPDGFEGTLVETATVSATPLQFITVDTKESKWVVSGAVYLEGITPSAKADSIAPVVQTLRRDIEAILDSISRP